MAEKKEVKKEKPIVDEVSLVHDMAKALKAVLNSAGTRVGTDAKFQAEKVLKTYGEFARK